MGKLSIKHTLYWESTVNLVNSIRETPLVGVEIGVKLGDLSYQLLSRCNWTLLYLVDPWTTFARSHRYRRSKDSMARCTEAQAEESYQTTLKITAFAGEKVKVVRDFSNIAANKIPDELDFVFVDADHSYEGVKEDLNVWWPKVRQGGILAGHDYGTKRDYWKQWGVKWAVDEFFKELNLPVVEHAGTVWSVHK